MNPEFPSERPESAAPVLTVSALNQAVGKLLERHFPLLWVSGEISNFTKAASGHWYFSLKDANAQVRAVMFRGRAQYADFVPREGDKVEVRTLVTLYAARGEYQLSVEAIRRAGVGNLYEAFLQLKQKLQAEGVFDAAHKRALPFFPRVIGIVTSVQAAALRDVISTVRRRAPHVQLIVYPTPVQGEGAAQKIAAALRAAARRAECDVLLLCRGGGSIEDLWAFNEEVVARAMVASPIPVIAGVGHETDFTIADFCADLRAPTPTAAAELATRPRTEWYALLERQTRELRRAVQRRASDQNQMLDGYARRLISPRAVIRHEQLRLAGLQAGLRNAVRTPLQDARHAWSNLRNRLLAQLPESQTGRRQLAELQRRLGAASAARGTHLRWQLNTHQQQLEMLNPQRTLERGYAILIDSNGAVVRAPGQLRPNTLVTARLAGGSAQVGIASVHTALEE